MLKLSREIIKVHINIQKLHISYYKRFCKGFDPIVSVLSPLLFLMAITNLGPIDDQKIRRTCATIICQNDELSLSFT